MENYRFPVRKPTRIRNFDYASKQYYFVTFCTHEKQCIFGSTEELNVLGKIAYADMVNLNAIYNGIRADPFIIMPNHVHAIIEIHNSHSITGKTTLSSVIGSYKSGVSRRIREIHPNMEVWQRSFHDHIIRNQKEYEKIYSYILFNAQKWEEDCFYPTKITP